jgi:hypothetical protein
MISKTEMNVIQLDKDSQGRWIIPIVNADPNHFKVHFPNSYCIVFSLATSYIF